MAQLQLSKELEKKMMEFPEVDWTKVTEEAITAKAFELRLSRSKELQRALMVSLASKSMLTEKSALELGHKASAGISKELKDAGLI